MKKSGVSIKIEPWSLTLMGFLGRMNWVEAREDGGLLRTRSLIYLSDIYPATIGLE